MTTDFKKTVDEVVFAVKEGTLDLVSPCLEKISEMIIKEEQDLELLDEQSTRLWNESVNLKLSKNESKVNSQEVLLIVANLRQTSLNMMEIIIKDSVDSSALRKLSSLYMKTGQIWFEVQNFVNAEKCYDKSSRLQEKLLKTRIQASTDYNSAQLTILKSQLSYFTASHSIAMHLMKAFLPKVSEEEENMDIPYFNVSDFSLSQKNQLSLLCLNCAEKILSTGDGVVKLDHAVDWLRFALELSPANSSIKGQTLLMLSSTYLERRRFSGSFPSITNTDLDLAESTIDVLLSMDQVSAQAFFLKIKILCERKAGKHTIFQGSSVFEKCIDENIVKTFPYMEKINVEKVTDLYLAMIHHVANYIGHLEAVTCIEYIMSKINGVKSTQSQSIFGAFIGKFLVTKLYLLVNNSSDAIMDEEIIEKTSSSLDEFINELEVDNLRSCLLVIWQAGDRANNEERFNDAIKWYNTALRLMGSDTMDKANSGEVFFRILLIMKNVLAVLYRKIALCYLETNQYEEVKEALESAEALEVSDYNNFLRCLIFIHDDESFVHLDEEARATEVLNITSALTCDDKNNLIICLAEAAFKKATFTSKFILKGLLKQILFNMDLEKEEFDESIIITFRCLIKLSEVLKTHLNSEEICSYCERLSNLKSIRTFKCGVAEFNWILSKSWNYLIEEIKEQDLCNLDTSKNRNFDLVLRFLNLYLKFLDFLPPENLDIDKLEKKKIAQFFLLATKMEKYKFINLNNELEISELELLNMNIFNELNVSLKNFRSTFSELEKLKYDAEGLVKAIAKEDDNTDEMLSFSVVIEFENWKEVTKIIEFAKKNYLSLMIFERFVDISIQNVCPGAGIYIKFTINILVTFAVVQATLDQILKKEKNFSLVKFSKWFRILIESGSATKNKFGLIELYRQVFGVIKNSKGKYPLEEVQWLMVSAWNNGLESLNFNNKAEAKVWVEFAVNFSNMDTENSAISRQIRKDYLSILQNLGNV
ncbi:hypothetical protein HK099_001465 [Clydaea vesicula]|uniref:Protein ZIP4 homolog n=1 Tax=Clydaea vesicula TaxID=447962 RepID=A0AAD5U6Z8_9FUNG|nr:hypothetical protein HK099_001465 [Clydaea vesicula]